MKAKDDTITLQGTGIVILTVCFFIMLLASFLFGVSNGYVGHPTAQVPAPGLVINLPASIIAWIVFFRGIRKSHIQSGIAIILLTLINYLLISNAWTAIFHA